MAYRLLLADDSITIQKVVELVLAEEDFDIKSMSNGEDALAVMDTFKPDVVLADIEMPKVNGYQLCEKIKQNPATAAIPVILLAGAFEPIDEELAASVGADDSIIKPFESQELISKINAALTMAAAVAGPEAAGDISFAEAEPFEIAEELGETEAVEVAGVEEDLWAMEEVTATAESADADKEALQEAGLDTSFALMEEEPAETPIPAAVAARPALRQEFVMPEIEMPSKEEILGVFEKAVKDKVPAMLASLDVREAVISSITPVLKESVEKVLWEIAPDLVEKMLKEILKDSISSLKAEVEKVLWETVPDLAGTMISKEIEKIKAEF